MASTVAYFTDNGVYEGLRISSRIAREIRGQKSLGIPSTPSPARRAVED